VKLGRELGRFTIADGVENAEQVEALRELGCDIGQGDWWCPPMPASQLEVELVRRAVSIGTSRSVVFDHER
jgi:EAL domain-containing protein (putative c-di-GMP-specific phosphodiesterase class I)